MTQTANNIITRMLQIHGQLPDGAVASGALASDMLTALNEVKRSMFGAEIGSKLSPQAVAGNTVQAENGGEYAIPGGAAAYVTAPLNPRGGDRFGVVDAGLAWSAYPLTVNPNGRLIQTSLGGTTTNGNVTLSTAGNNTRWWYRGDTATWLPEADWALTSVIEFPDTLTAYLPWLLAVAVGSDLGVDITEYTAGLAQEGRAKFRMIYGRKLPPAPVPPPQG